MARCPSCNSSRLRSGYRKTALALRAVGVRTLLCDDCNCEFRGFSPLPPKRVKHRARKADVFNKTQEFDLQAIGQPGATARKRLDHVSFDRAALPMPAAVAPARAPQPVRETPEELRRRISAAPTAVPTEEPLMKLREDMEERRHSVASHACPECDSSATKRRHRKAWEKLVLSLTELRPYSCGECGAEFYARRNPHQRRQPALSRNEEEFVKSSCFNQEREGEDA